MTEKKTPEIIFAPGCFDNFDGTQEELDELMAQIQGMFENGVPPESVQVIELSEEDLEDFDEDFDIVEAPKYLH